MSEYPQALKVREEKPTDSDEPASKKPRISSYPKLLFDKLWEMTDPVTKVSYNKWLLISHILVLGMHVWYT